MKDLLKGSLQKMKMLKKHLVMKTKGRQTVFRQKLRLKAAAHVVKVVAVEEAVAPEAQVVVDKDAACQAVVERGDLGERDRRRETTNEKRQTANNKQISRLSFIVSRTRINNKTNSTCQQQQ